MLATLLEGENPGYSQYIMLGIVVLLIVVIAVFYFLTNKKRKKQEQDAQDLINAVKPGNKVKTIGGICGIVVEVDNEENTFVLETGTELSGKSYIKFDRQAIYQTSDLITSSEYVFWAYERLAKENEMPSATKCVKDCLKELNAMLNELLAENGSTAIN